MGHSLVAIVLSPDDDHYIWTDRHILSCRLACFKSANLGGSPVRLVRYNLSCKAWKVFSVTTATLSFGHETRYGGTLHVGVARLTRDFEASRSQCVPKVPTGEYTRPEAYSDASRAGTIDGPDPVSSGSCKNGTPKKDLRFSRSSWILPSLRVEPKPLASRWSTRIIRHR